MKILVTGGAGFIGANFLNLLVPRHPEHHFINLDKLTYAANPLSLSALDNADNYEMTVADIVDYEAIDAVFTKHAPELVVHFAAESHVDRSISGPAPFIKSNIEGTFNLLEACRKHWEPGQGLFHHVSTDEVYGSLGDTGLFTEETRYDPSSPYSASKAASDHLVRAYHRTFKAPDEADQLLQQLRTVPVPRETHPLDDPQCQGPQAAAGLRRGAQRARLALRHRPLRGDLGSHRQGQGRRDLQHRRAQRDAQHRRRPHVCARSSPN